MSHIPIRIIQISDIHLFADPKDNLLGVNTQESFEAIVQAIQQDKILPQLIVLSGDLTQNGHPNAYQRVAEQFEALAVPVYCLPGNHDNSDTMAAIYPYGPILSSRQIVLSGWQLILLDSHKSDVQEGYLAEDQFNFLRECLQAYPNHYAIIMFHHQPVPVGSAWLDNIGLKNAEVFWQTIAAYPQVHMVLFGHVHQQYDDIKNGLAIHSSPSTCIQFKTHSDVFALENLPPGYRWIDLHADGRLETGVCRLAHYIGQFEKDAKGY